MTNVELIQAIRNEIERLKGICTAQIKANPGQTFPFVMEMTGYDKILSFLSALEQSEKPVNPEDAMKELDEKIALVKRRGTWDGVDVDKYMDEVRGRETPLPEDTVLFNKGVAEGKRLMMEDAVEGLFQNTPFPTICLDDCKDYNFKDEDKVRVIVCKKED